MSHFSADLSFPRAKEGRPDVLSDSFKMNPSMNIKWVIHIIKYSIINESSMKKGIVKNRRSIIMSTLGE